jgi:serine/threonine protein phosphatase 1
MIAVIGDVHGCFYTLQNLVEKIRQKYQGIPIYCVGDLVDRGNHSFEVFEYVISEKIIFTPGNHDYMFYSSIRDPGSLMGKSWRFNGAETTLTSYKDKFDQMNEHLDLIISSPLFINSEDAFISHAGISAYYKDKLPKDYINKLSEFEKILKEDLFDQNSIIWARGDLLNIGKLQIVGHTHRKEVFFDKDSNVLYIDTTAYGNNKLTAAIIEKNELLETIEEKTHPDDINRNWSIYS